MIYLYPMKVCIINGPNLNLLGRREQEIYGNQDFESFYKLLQLEFSTLDLEYFQSNVEGEIVTKLQEFGNRADGIVLNAAAYTHTSIAIADAVAAIQVPTIEVHISNLLSRENFRHQSLIGPYCKGSIMGFGLNGYRLALHSFIR